MGAGYWPIEITQAETWHRELSWVVKDQTTGIKTLVDTTGATALLQVRRTVADATVLLELSTENGGITLGGDPFNIILDVPAQLSADLSWAEPETATYDLFIDYAPPTICLLAGPATLRHAVSRALVPMPLTRASGLKAAGRNTA